ncbi:hypothetical protein CLOP_g16499 [Closterium sp. NIES-67]|nr:hypothetical protein CLOP_g16499 [Closterium sp. NIES-67]
MAKESVASIRTLSTSASLFLSACLLAALVPACAALGSNPTTASLAASRGVPSSAAPKAGPQISSLLLLLPPRARNPVRFHLLGSNGCFSWAWDHHDLLHVEPLYNTTADGNAASDTAPPAPPPAAPDGRAWSSHGSSSSSGGPRGRCSTSAIISSTARYSGAPRTTAVIATDVLSGALLRCEVRVDLVQRVAIFHRSLKMGLSSLADLEVLAFNDQGDVFSSVAGLAFHWSLTPVLPAHRQPDASPAPRGGRALEHRLEHVPLEEAALLLEGDERRGAATDDLGVERSDVYVVRGVAPGQERVSVELMDADVTTAAASGAAAPPSLPSDAITLTVAQAFSLQPPSPVLLLPGARLPFRLLTFTDNTVTPVSLPSPSYAWATGNASVASVHPAQGLLSALAVGSTTLTAADVRMADHQQAASIHVVPPGDLKIFLVPLGEGGGAGDGEVCSDAGAPGGGGLPGAVACRALAEPVASGEDTWHLVVGREYALWVQVFAHGWASRPVLLTEADTLLLRFDHPPLWTVLGDAHAGTGAGIEAASRLVPATVGGGGGGGEERSRVVVVRGGQQGKGDVQAELWYREIQSGGKGREEKVVVAQAIRVCDPVAVHLPSAALTPAAASASSPSPSPSPSLGDPVRVVHLPWVPQLASAPAHLRQHLLLLPSGGCGRRPADYDWTSSDTTVVHVAPSGWLTVAGPGVATVRVTAAVDANNYHQVEVRVSVPRAMVLMAEDDSEALHLGVRERVRVEALVGDALLLAARLLSSSGVPYTNCTALNPFTQWHLQPLPPATTPVFALVSPPPLAATTPSPLSPICVWAPLSAIAPGRTHATALLPMPPSTHAAAADTGDTERTGGGGGEAEGQGVQGEWTVAGYEAMRVAQLGDGWRQGGYGLPGALAAAAAAAAGRHGDLSAAATGGLPSAPAAAPPAAAPAAAAALSIGAGLSVPSLLLAPGASMAVAVAGGPDRWIPGRQFLEEVHVVGVGEKGQVVAGRGEKEGKGGGARWEGEGGGAVVVERVGSRAGREYVVWCERGIAANHSFHVTFTRGHLPSPHALPAPLPSASFLLHCSLPAAAAVLLDDSARLPSAIAAAAASCQHPVADCHLPPITLVTHQHVRLVAAALSPSAFPFANASSQWLPAAWQLEGCDDVAWLANVADKSSTGAEWSRWVDTGGMGGECLVHVDVAALHAKHGSPHPFHIRGTATLQVVTALRLDPQAADVTVTGGTSELQFFISDQSVAAIVPHGAAPTVQLAARAQGDATLTAVDSGLSHPLSANASVAVADVAWVRLHPEGAQPATAAGGIFSGTQSSGEWWVQVGATARISLSVGDTLGRLFPTSQFAWMGLEAHGMAGVVSLRLPCSPASSAGGDVACSDSLELTGTAVGVTTALQVSAGIHLSSRRVFSDAIRITVYAPLALLPPALVLAPGASYLLQATGGPSSPSTTIAFASSHADVAQVDSFSGLVTSRAVGTAVIRAMALGSAGQVLSAAESRVEVRVMERVALSVGNGQLAVGEEMAVFPTGEHEGEDVLSFARVCRSYHWTVSHPQHLQLHTAAPLATELSVRSSSGGGNSGDGESNSDSGAVDIGFSARITARAPGTATVSLAFSCSFPSSPPLRRSYSASATITVVPTPPLALGIPATWLLPIGYTSSPLLPHSLPTTTAEGASSAAAPRYSYSLLQSPPNSAHVSLAAGGRISTADRASLGCIAVSDSATGRHEIAACVRSAQAAQLTVGDNDFPFHAAELSVPAQQLFSVHLRDSLGVPFLEVSDARVEVEVDRPDVVSVAVVASQPDRDTWQPANLTVVVKAVQQGTAVVRVRVHPGPGRGTRGSLPLVDFITVQVGAYVFPRDPLVPLGASLNFSLSHRHHQQAFAGSRGGRWVSGNSSVLLVDGSTGEARAVGEGATVVSFNASRLTTYTRVTVLPVLSVAVHPPHATPLLGNAPPLAAAGRPVHFPVQFSDSRGQRMGRPVGSPDVPFSCHVAPSMLGTAAPRFDSASQSYVCAFTPAPPARIFSALTLSSPSSSAATAAAVAGRLGGTHRGEAGSGVGGVAMAVTAVVEAAGAGLGARPAVQGEAVVPFVGGFDVLGGGEIALSLPANSTTIRLVGNTSSVQVAWRNKAALVVRRAGSGPWHGGRGVSQGSRAPGAGGARSGSRASEGLAVLADETLFAIQVMLGDHSDHPPASFEDDVVFTDPGTGQRETVHVTFNAAAPPAAFLPLNLLWLAALTAAIATLILLLLHLVSPSHPYIPQPRPPPSPLPTPSPQRPGSAFQTPSSGPFSPVSPFSQMRSPSPEYVSYAGRTIHRAPGYTNPMEDPRGMY